MSKLIPPDFKRCQAEIKHGNAFSFGPVTWNRCEKKPDIIAIERKKGRDLQKGSMSLCLECSLELSNREPRRAIMKKIKVKK